MQNSKLAIYVSSYDGCSDLWDTFFQIFDCFWKDCNFPIYLINNEKKYEHNRVITLNSGKEVNWFYRTILTLEQLDEEYVMFMLEDYYLSKNIINSNICDILSYMDTNNIYYYQLSLIPVLKGVKTSEQYVNVSDKSEYPISLQPAIWNRLKLLELLKEINGKSPWDFEYYLHSIYSKPHGVVMGVAYDTRDILGYKNGVLRGKWIPATLSFYKSKGIIIKTGNREKLTLPKVIKYYTAVKLSDTLSPGLKTIIKKILNCIGFNYLR